MQYDSSIEFSPLLPGPAQPAVVARYATAAAPTQALCRVGVSGDACGAVGAPCGMSQGDVAGHLRERRIAIQLHAGGANRVGEDSKALFSGEEWGTLGGS